MRPSQYYFEREQLQAEIEAYLNAGGQIRTLPAKPSEANQLESQRAQIRTMRAKHYSWSAIASTLGLKISECKQLERGDLKSVR
jgi:hypothetical protein